jgi:hypothetical protein
MKKEDQEELLSISPTRLTQLVIRVEARMMLASIIYLPRTFEDVRSDQFEFMAKGYFVQTLSKQWLEEVPRRIRMWKNVINEFKNEFNGNQRYYAVCKKLKAVEEYGPEDYDLDEEGELLWADGSKIPDRNLESSTVLNDLYMNECRDIIQDFIPDDISHICSDVCADASMDFRDIFAGITEHIPDSYTFDGHGNIHKVTFEEHEMMKAVRGANAVELTDVLVLLAETMCRMCGRLHSWLRQKTVNDDITKEINTFLDDCEKIENLELTETDVIQDYFKKQENNYA